LKEAAFVIGRHAEDETDRIIYDKDGGGYLYYDPDGTGSAQEVAFAKVGAIDLSHAAFWVI
jgi:hypothetical protein